MKRINIFACPFLDNNIINVFFCFELSINFLKFADDFADGMGGWGKS